jgi:hypothetical protein
VWQPRSVWIVYSLGALTADSMNNSHSSLQSPLAHNKVENFEYMRVITYKSKCCHGGRRAVSVQVVQHPHQGPQIGKDILHEQSILLNHMQLGNSSVRAVSCLHIDGAPLMRFRVGDRRNNCTNVYTRVKVRWAHLRVIYGDNELPHVPVSTFRRHGFATRRRNIE